MSAAAELLADLRRDGFTLTVTPDGLSVTPRSCLTSSLRAAIVEHKLDLVALLTTEASSSLNLSAPTSPATPSASAPAGTKGGERASPFIPRGIKGGMISHPVCPACGDPGQRLGIYRLDDGRG